LSVVAAPGLTAFALFPDDLAFLTRALAAAMFVLSLDLVVGFAGVATLGHAALFGAGAYPAGIACTRGRGDPVALMLIAALSGGGMGVAAGAVILRASGLPQLVLSIATVQLVHEAANKAAWLTGGSDGLAGIAPAPVLGLFEFDFWGRTGYLFGLAWL